MLTALLALPASAQNLTKDEQDLATACRQGNADEANAVLARGMKVSSLLVAMCIKHPEVLRVVAERCKQIDEPFGPRKDTNPMLAAIFSGNPEAVRILLEAGADPNSRAVGAQTPIELARMLGKTEMLKLMSSITGDKPVVTPDAFYMAALAGETDRVREMIEAGADLHARAELGDTALHGAANGGREDIVRLLLEAGADPNARGATGATPLMRAAGASSAGSVRALLGAGADVDALDDDGVHPIEYSPGVDGVNEQLEGASPMLQEFRNAKTMEDGGEYDPGQKLTGPCLSAGSHAGPHYCGQTGTSQTVVTSIASNIPHGLVKPPLCKPVELPEGGYTVTVMESVYDWEWVCEIKLRQTTGVVTNIAKLEIGEGENRITKRKVNVRQKDKTRPPKEKPAITIVNPGDGATFNFNRATPGTLELQLEADVSPARCEKSVTWDIEIGSSRMTKVPKGHVDNVIFTGLPKNNDDFGSVIITANACGVSSSPVEVFVFYPLLAKNHPPPAQEDTPNWYYYWKQTRAAGVTRRLFYQDKVLSDTTGQPNYGKYDYSTDRIILSDMIVDRRCPCRQGKMFRDTSQGDPVCPRTAAAEGIDCFAETIRHEAQHRREAADWWQGTDPVGLRATDEVAYHAKDADGDLVPNRIEELHRGCLFLVRKSCSDRPDENLIDNEMFGYTSGWFWPINNPSLADNEDWGLDDRPFAISNCNNNKWKGACPPAHW
jgi:ankyrin repeat protein